MGSGSVLSCRSAWIARLFRTSGQCQDSNVARAFCVAAIGIAACVIFLVHRSPFIDPQSLLSATGLGLASFSAQRKRAGLKLESMGSRRAPGCDSAVFRNLIRLILTGFELLRAKGAFVVLSDAQTSREYKWKVPSASPEPEKIAELLELCTAGIESNWGLAAFSRVGPEIRCLVLDKEGSKLRKVCVKNSSFASWNGAYKTTAVSNFKFDSRWKGQIIFCDPLLPEEDEASFRGVQRMVRLFDSSYRRQQRRLSEARMEERNEIARDLHDGVTQSLIAAEMHVEALRRRGALAGIPAAANEILVQTQELLQREVRKLRLQIEDLRSNSNCVLICQQLSEVIENFESDSGIRVTFVCDSERPEVSAQSAHDLIHIVREALSNIRRHSGATKVEIRFRVDREIHLVVQDDGCGFDFCGKQSLADLEASGKGPRVIRERVRLSGGNILIESRPNLGARVELTLPSRARISNRESFNRDSLPPKIGVRRDTAGKQFNVA